MILFGYLVRLYFTHVPCGRAALLIDPHGGTHWGLVACLIFKYFGIIHRIYAHGIGEKYSHTSYPNSIMSQSRIISHAPCTCFICLWLYEKIEHMLLLVQENNTSRVSQYYYYIMCFMCINHIFYIKTQKVIHFKTIINYRAFVPHLLWSHRY